MVASAQDSAGTCSLVADRAAGLDRIDGHDDRRRDGRLHPDGEQVVAALCGLRAGRVLDEARPGQPRKLGDADIERVIVRTLESKPERRHALVDPRSMAQATGLNQTAISRIWRAF